MTMQSHEKRYLSSRASLSSGQFSGSIYSPPARKLSLRPHLVWSQYAEDAAGARAPSLAPHGLSWASGSPFQPGFSWLLLTSNSEAPLGLSPVGTSRVPGHVLQLLLQQLTSLGHSELGGSSKPSPLRPSENSWKRK